MMWEVVTVGASQVLSNGQTWTVRTAAEERVKHFHQGGGEYYAVITLRVELYDGPEGIVFINAARPANDFTELDSEDEEDAKIFVEGVIEGIGEALNALGTAGFAITNLLILLIELRLHSVDSCRSAYSRAAVLALKQCLKRDNLIPMN